MRGLHSGLFGNTAAHYVPPPVGGGGEFTVQTAAYVSQETPFTTSFVVPMPAGTGGRLLWAIATTWTNTFTTPTDWGILYDWANSTSPRVDFWVLERDATGFTDSTVTLTVGAADLITAIVMRINGAAGAPEAVATGTTGKSVSPSPPSLSPSGGSAPYLWIPLAGLSGPSTTPTYPTGYTNTLTAAHVTNDGNHSRVMAAWKEATAATETPDPFGVAGVMAWSATTVAYPKAA